MSGYSVTTYLFLLFLVMFSAFFSATETAFSTVSRARLKNLSQSGNRRAKRALQLLEQYDATLTALLIGNNIVNIAAASIGTIVCTDLFGSAGVAISTFAMTAFILIFGEVLPKTTARDHAVSMCLFAASIMRFFFILFWPICFVIGKLKKAVARPESGESNVMTEEELRVIIDEIEDEGVLEEEESDLFRAALAFDDITVDEILTPRVDIEAVGLTASREEILERFLETHFSRLPVYEGTIDSIAGVLYQHDFLQDVVKEKDTPIEQLIRPTLFVPPTKSIAELMKELQRQKIHMAVVTDSYGGTIGIVTLEDIIEELVGEIYDEHDEVDTSFVELPEGEYMVSADVDVEDFCEYFGLAYQEDRFQSRTLGGLMMELTGRIPEMGEAVDLDSLHIVVKEREDNRITKLQVSRIPQPAEKKDK